MKICLEPMSKGVQYQSLVECTSFHKIQEQLHCLPPFCRCCLPPCIFCCLLSAMNFAALVCLDERQVCQDVVTIFLFCRCCVVPCLWSLCLLLWLMMGWKKRRRIVSRNRWFGSNAATCFHLEKKEACAADHSKGRDYYRDCRQCWNQSFYVILLL